MQFDQFIDQVGEEVDRLKAEGATLEDAHREALRVVFMRVVEGRKTDPFEDLLLEKLEDIARRQGGAPVKTVSLATELGQSQWNTWRYLSELEQRGLVYRPGGNKAKSGYLTA